jgi:hypothetical protein
MYLALAAILFLQPLLTPHAYLTGDPVALVTLSGTYEVEFGSGCEDIMTLTNLELLSGSGGVAAIAPLDSDIVCNIYIGQRQSDTPCVQTDGVCDVNGQE